MKIDKIKAAILVELNKPLEVSNIQPMPLEYGQILVKIFYSGVCRSQLMEVSGQRGYDKWIPHLLGHEASGVVIDSHKSCKKFKIGDEVILTWIKSSGKQTNGVSYRRNNEKINAGNVTTFSNYSVVSENRAVLKPKGLGFNEAMLFGCAIPTGAGMVMNEVNPSEDSSIIIIGLGGIGLSALIMSIALKVKNIAVIDTNKTKLDLARKLGVRHVYHGGIQSIKNDIFLDHPDGFDYCVESAGLADTIELGFELINSKSGHLYFASHPPNDQMISLKPHELISGKKISGSWGGATNPDKDIPKMWEIIKRSNLELKSLITTIYNIDEINDAMEDIKNGRVFRPLIKMNHE